MSDTVTCGDSNPAPLLVTATWNGPPDVAVTSQSRVLQLSNVDNTDAGVYSCTLTSGLTGETLSASFTLIVHCKWF